MIDSALFLLLGALCAGLIAAWVLVRLRALRKSRLTARVQSPTIRSSELVTVPAGSIDVARLAAANALFAERLWRLAYGAPADSEALERVHAEVRVAVVARLDPSKINPEFFPRRPALMQQLMHAIEDPEAQAEKLSRIIAHDPVISADVLRIANSSLYRTTPEPIESIQRAIVACGIESLKGILMTAMVRPVFRANSRNFPRLPRVLWDRTERAVRLAEWCAQLLNTEDRFEAQLAVLLRALGPLVVHAAANEAYAQRPKLKPSPALLVELTTSLADAMSIRLAQEWKVSQRLIDALSHKKYESLSLPILIAELLGTLCVLSSAGSLSPSELTGIAQVAGLEPSFVFSLLERAGFKQDRVSQSKDPGHTTTTDIHAT